MTDLVLHGYWRSSAAYRVRIALAMKGVSYRQVSYDLRIGAQHAPPYRAIAPHGLVPALTIQDEVFIESPAILEWIDARWPEPPLLPDKANDAAAVRAMAALIGCDIHPLGNLRVLQALRVEFSASESQISAWIARWIGDGFAALEDLIGRHGGTYCFGDQPTLADCYLVPQVYNAERYLIDLSPYPRLVQAATNARQLAAFVAAEPSIQLDADPQ